VADVAPYRNRQTGKVQDLTREQADLFPGLYAPLNEQPKTDLGTDAASDVEQVIHTPVPPTVGATKTGD
jgi:hypothetical protein